jgi:hypothetical protein
MLLKLNYTFLDFCTYYFIAEVIAETATTITVMFDNAWGEKVEVLINL